MDAPTKAAALLAAVIILFCPVSLSGEADASGGLDGLLLYEVNAKTCEGVAVHNYGSSAVDMADYVIADMPGTSGTEGTLTFTESLIVPAGGTAVFVSEYIEGNAFAEQDDVHLYGEDGVTASGRFVLANTGDDVYLIKDGEIVDAVFYGSKESDGTYWTGDAVSLGGDRHIVRTGSTDTDTAEDWSVYGQTDYGFDPDLEYDASVTPFLFPESGGVPVYQALESATASIRVNIYQLTSTNVLSLLCQKAAEGVKVQLLLEGDVLADSDPVVATSAYLMTLVGLGGEVRIIGGTDDDRYTYDHAKYAIIDGDTVVVTSENWTAANMNGGLDSDPYDDDTSGNRGWGAVIESCGYAAYMLEVFLNDWSTDYGDVTPFEEKYPNASTRSYSYSEPESASFASYEATVTPVLSGDNSYEALEYYVSEASSRVYAEQQSLGSGYDDLEDDSPVSLMSAAAQLGADCRAVFGSNVDSEAVLKINMGTGVQAAIMDSPYVHNKGLIADDRVWVSSVNWTSTSFFDNRECCAVISSAEVADFFAASLLEDFGSCYTYGGFEVTLSNAQSSYESGAEVCIIASVSVSGTYTYEWALSDGTTSGDAFIITRPSDGSYTLTLVVTSSDGVAETVEWSFTVGDVPESGTSGSEEDSGAVASSLLESAGDSLYIVLLLLVVFAALCVAASGRGRGPRRRRGRR